MSINELSEGTPTADDESRQSVLRKVSDFLYNGGFIASERSSKYQVPRYARLELANMFTSLVALYTRAFATQWVHFSRVSETINPAETPIEECQRLMAELYISHWMMDLYTTVRRSVNKLAPVAYGEFYTTSVPLGSNVYDAFLAHLNSVIRPTHVTGCPEETLFIPHFADTIDMSNNNPFNIQGFTLNLPSLIAIINAIKVVWNTATLTSEMAGRPVWLFDWHKDACVCSWFPKEGNYSYEDVMFAYVIGVACTPKQALKDSDEWQSIPKNMTADCIDVARVPRVEPRQFFGGYEVDTYDIHEAKFYVPSTTSDVKRGGTSCSEGDESQPSDDTLMEIIERVFIRRHTTFDESQPSDDTSMEIIEHTFIRHTTFIYYARVIFDINDDDRLTTLLGLLEGADAHSIC